MDPLTVTACVIVALIAAGFYAFYNPIPEPIELIITGAFAALIVTAALMILWSLFVAFPYVRTYWSNNLILMRDILIGAGSVITVGLCFFKIIARLTKAKP